MFCHDLMVKGQNMVYSICAYGHPVVFVSVLDYPILVMGTNSTKGNGLPFVINILMETSIRERTIIGMVVFCPVSYLSKNFFISLFCQGSLPKSKNLHKMHINEVTNMVAKICGAPDPIACGKISHLWDKTGLCQNNLIY